MLSKLVVLGRIVADVTLDNVTKNKLELVVVPDSTVSFNVVLDRDILKNFDLVQSAGKERKTRQLTQ